MSRDGSSDAELCEEIRSLREEVDRLHRMLMLVAGTIAMVEGQQNELRTYVKRVLAELEDSSTGHERKESAGSEKLISDLERGLKIMADEAEEMDLPDLAKHLRE